MPDDADLDRTRSSWHRVAEHVLAAGQFAAAGTIRLRPVPGGFGTVADVGGQRLAVVGDRMVVGSGTGARSAPLTTLRAAATLAGIEPGLTGSYRPTTSADPDEPLDVDPAAARLLADWFALGDVALRRLPGDTGAGDPVLWPEHFDLSRTIDAVNYGASPGDDAVGEPYLYVGPHAGPPVRDEFWNASFGATVTAAGIAAADDAVAFFTRGRELLAGR